MKKRNSGKLITLEGPEGAGKSTQCATLVRWLREAGYEYAVTREPGGTEVGESIRRILLDPGLDIATGAEILLYAADRAQHVEKVIAPALEKGKIVVCDRYYDSTMAYQGYARGLGPDFVEQVNKLSVGHFVLDLTLIFDCPVDRGIERKVRKGLDRMEQEDLDFHRRVREGYLKIAEKEPERVKVIDARNDIETVARDAIEAVSAFLKSGEAEGNA